MALVLQFRRHLVRISARLPPILTVVSSSLQVTAAIIRESRPRSHPRHPYPPSPHLTLCSVAMHLKGSTGEVVRSITKPVDLCIVTQKLSAMATSAEQLNNIPCKIKRTELRFQFGTSGTQVRTFTALSVPSASTVGNTITSRQTNRKHHNGP